GRGTAPRCRRGSATGPARPPPRTPRSRRGSLRRGTGPRRRRSGAWPRRGLPFAPARPRRTSSALATPRRAFAFPVLLVRGRRRQTIIVRRFQVGIPARRAVDAERPPLERPTAVDDEALDVVAIQLHRELRLLAARHADRQRRVADELVVLVDRGLRRRR